MENTNKGDTLQTTQSVGVTETQEVNFIQSLDVSRKNLGRFKMLCVCNGVNPTQENFDVLLENFLAKEISKTGMEECDNCDEIATLEKFGKKNLCPECLDGHRQDVMHESIHGRDGE